MSTIKNIENGIASGAGKVARYLSGETILKGPGAKPAATSVTRIQKTMAPQNASGALKPKITKGMVARYPASPKSMATRSGVPTYPSNAAMP